MQSGAAATLSQVLSLSIECGDCGRMRWRKPQELYRLRGVSPSTPIAELGSRLVCSVCQSDGLDGRNISIQAAFSLENDRIRADAWRVNNQAVREAG
jgi:acid phosphatase family membrane protein YuiD